MAPLIETGSKLIIDWHPKIFKLGDVVLFFSHYNRLVAHRIVAVAPSGTKKHYLIKGDNTFHDDGWFEEAQLVGRVRKIIRRRKSS